MTDFVLNTDNILCNFPSCLRKSVEELCLKSQIVIDKIDLHSLKGGDLRFEVFPYNVFFSRLCTNKTPGQNLPKTSSLGSICLQDISILSNRFNDEENLNNYHFMIKIPYAGKRLKWEVIFDPEDFYFAPDFEFNDDHFLNTPDYEIITSNVPSLENWDLKDPKALSRVLNEFILLYKKFQIEKLVQDNIYSRYYEEYQMLISEEHGVKAEDVEIYIDATSISFLVLLKIDCSSLPEYKQPPDNDNTICLNPGEDYAHLKICFIKLDGTRSNITLQLSPRLEQVLGNSSSMSLPEYKRETPLNEYVAKVSHMIRGHIETVVDHFKMKKIYIMNLVTACSHSIVEYDTETFNKAVFLYNVNDYSCLVTVTMGSKFPQEKPSIQLSSIYCQDEKQCNEKLDKYPYSVNNLPNSDVDLLLQHLPEAVRKFKNHKH